MSAQIDWANYQTEEKLPRDVKPGDEAWIYSDGSWGFFKVTEVTKTPQKRATFKSTGHAARYVIRFEGVAAPRTWPPRDKLRVFSAQGGGRDD